MKQYGKNSREPNNLKRKHTYSLRIPHSSVFHLPFGLTREACKLRTNHEITTTIQGGGCQHRVKMCTFGWFAMDCWPFTEREGQICHGSDHSVEERSAFLSSERTPWTARSFGHPVSTAWAPLARRAPGNVTSLRKVTQASASRSDDWNL